MNDLEIVNTAAAAFIAGLVTSVHCIGMCGPLACGIAGLGKGAMRHGAAAGYHAGRMMSYALLGAVAGAIGEVPVRALARSPAVLLPWVLVVGLLVIGFGLDRFLPRLPVLGRLAGRLRGWFVRLGPGRGGLALGLATPLLPCTPLYLVLGAALVSGNAARGAEFLAAFALGTVPLLWVTQGGWLWLRGRFGDNGMEYARRALAIATALVLAWRLRGSLPWIDPPGPGCCG